MVAQSLNLRHDVILGNARVRIVGHHFDDLVLEIALQHDIVEIHHLRLVGAHFASPLELAIHISANVLLKRPAALVGEIGGFQQGRQHQHLQRTKINLAHLRHGEDGNLLGAVQVRRQIH